MDDSAKTRRELIGELASLRRRVGELQDAVAGRMAPSAHSPPRGCCVLQGDAESSRHGGSGRGDAPVSDESAEAGLARAKTALGEIKAPLEDVLNVPIVIWVLDRDGIFLLCEGKNLEAMGVEPGELVGRSVYDLYGDIPQITDGIRRAIAGESVALTAEVDGIVLANWYSPFCDKLGNVVGMVGVLTDVTKRQQAEAALFVEQRLMREMLHWHERDRRLIAYEIHDGLVQNVTGAQMHLESLLRSGKVPAGAARDELELALDQVRKAVSESRRLINGLRPPILDERGVVSAIKHLIDDQPADGPSIELTVQVQFDRLEPLLEGTIYRIVQEAITNVRRHSKSDRAEIRLVQDNDRVQLEIRDWGVGFNPADVEQECLGLQGIRERARLLHGRAVIDSSPGKGTRVFVDLPIAGTPNEIAIMNDRSVE